MLWTFLQWLCYDGFWYIIENPNVYELMIVSYMAYNDVAYDTDDSNLYDVFR
jgi:hypothetical protein